jgi:SAM-dependent methyltransferase
MNDSNHYTTRGSFIESMNWPFTAMAFEMSCYALSVFYPALFLKSMGVYRPRELGAFPLRFKVSGSGQLYCLEQSRPSLLDQAPPGYDQVEQFDQLSILYEGYVTAFTQPIVSEALNIIAPLLTEQTRILDLSCGPGKEIRSLAQLVPKGEVVGIDLSAGMLEVAYENARARNLRNTNFFQADVAKMPGHFTARFDALFCCLAFHHYPSPIAAISEMHRVLTPGGVAFIIDPTTLWFNQMSEPLASWADPGWVSFYSAEEFHRMFMSAGFSAFYWTELLPGIGLCIVTN